MARAIWPGTPKAPATRTNQARRSEAKPLWASGTQTGPPRWEPGGPVRVNAGAADRPQEWTVLLAQTG
jgi:hypothetical protein